MKGVDRAETTVDEQEEAARMKEDETDRRPVLYPYFERTASQLLAQYGRSKLQESSSSIGDNREMFVNEFLSKVLPPRLQVRQRAEVWDSGGNRTGELDIVILRDDAPTLEFGGQRDVFLAEGVFAVIEVKSNLTREKLKEALTVLRRVQSLNLSGAHPVMRAGLTLDRPLRCVFAYEGATWDTLDDELDKPDNRGVADSVSVLGKGILVSTALVDELLEREGETQYELLEGRAASLALLYYLLVSLATTFMARTLSLTDYFEPAERWLD
jgi:hypothetical protein